MPDPIHPRVTRKSKYRYQFTAKHHRGSKGDAQWLATISRAEEFSIFNDADAYDFSDAVGRLYGVLRDGNGNLREIGTWNQQMAEFPRANTNVAWHGYPIWAVNKLAPPNRRNQKARPAKQVFDKMEQAGAITVQQRRRLFRGDHA